MPVPNFSAGEILTASAMNQVGMFLIKTQVVGSAQSTVDVTACFSSTYDNYRVSYTGGTGSAPLELRMQFLVGTTPTATNYNGGRAVINVGTGAWVVSADNNATYFYCGAAANSPGYTYICQDIYQPNINGPTMASGFFSRIDFGQVGQAFTHQNTSTQHTGFRITASGGTISGGTIRVYGYRN